MKKFFRSLYSSKMILLMTFILNVAFYLTLAILVNSFTYGIISAVAAIITLSFIMASKDGYAYKITWVLIIFILPLFGVTLYAYMKVNKGGRKKRERWNNINFNSLNYLKEDETVSSELQKIGSKQQKISTFVKNSCSLPVYSNSTTTYLPDGETYFKELFYELKQAKKYIFLEYFIFKEGQVFDYLFEVLKEKAREGVEIKILYDDFGCLDRFEDNKIFKKLSNYKIEALAFNKISYRINAFINYRTHRKIAVIDGKVGFTGGINIGDEYCNLEEKFGHWKDTGVKITGDAGWGLTILFLNSWQFTSGKYLSDYSEYYPEEQTKVKSKELVQVFGTSPLTKEQSARDIYLNLINNAQKSIVITTPYFIIDEETCDALKICAKSGVDVSIIFPAIPDKKIPYFMGRSRFAELIKMGVKIYQYTPGFIHAKMIVVDNETAVVGTINMDFRSLYLHFENAVMIHNSNTTINISKDLKDVINQSHLVTLKDMRKRKLREKFTAKLLRFFEPLM